MYRSVLTAVTALLLALCGAAQAAAPVFTEGQGYDRLAAVQPVDHPGKVVVTEFFWYNCPHCAEFEPALEAWAKRQPGYVVLERVPVAFAPQFVEQQKLYYALLALGKANALQGQIFNAIHEQHIPLQTSQQMADWLQGHGVPRQQFLNAFNSFSVQMQANRASQMMADYQISGVPTLAVQGTYTLSASLPQTSNHELLLQSVDQLVRQLHQQGGKASP